MLMGTKMKTPPQCPNPPQILRCPRFGRAAASPNHCMLLSKGATLCSGLLLVGAALCQGAHSAAASDWATLWGRRPATSLDDTTLRQVLVAVAVPHKRAGLGSSNLDYQGQS